MFCEAKQYLKKSTSNTIHSYAQIVKACDDPALNTAVLTPIHSYAQMAKDCEDLAIEAAAIVNFAANKVKHIRELLRERYKATNT